ncbi:type II toxin-antitoxin system VapC family toxin [bacterium]|nr:type II toxin-antitoxin system VapC family toxin [bacterium]
MKYLLDTHVLIYLGCGYGDQIGKKALEIYKDPDTQIFVSQISFWEMAVKINIGKLHIPIGLQNVIIQSQQAGIETISVQNSHILFYQSLDVKENHKDPFDRYIIATAISEDLQILSSDKKFDLYQAVVRVWED